MVEDENYARFAFAYDTSYAHCKAFQNCVVVEAPFTDGKTGGGGWIFPKRSRFRPLFNQFFWDLKEKGLLQRIKNEPKHTHIHTSRLG